MKTGKYKIFSIGGAISHPDYRLMNVQEYGDDWKILPTNGYGNEQLIRDIIDNEKIDVIWFMTDPRFYGWLFNMSDEIHDRGIPTLYYHVWDDGPIPHFNTPSYKSCSFIGCISKLTYDIVKTLCGTDNCQYIPHGIDINIFKPFTKEEIIKHKKDLFNGNNNDKFVIFYNSRNARRKMTSTIVEAYAEFLKIVGKDKAFMLMHSDPNDPEGANLFAVCELLKLGPSQILFSKDKVPSDQVAIFYNISDCTINISNNEGFGLSCLESLACGKPIVVNKTGGLQDQATDDEGNELGVVLEPLTRTLTGSQEIPYIYDDRNSVEQVVQAFLKLYNMSEEEKEKIGQLARNNVLKKFDKKYMIELWDKAIQKYYNEFKQFGNKQRIKFTKI